VPTVADIKRELWAEVVTAAYRKSPAKAAALTRAFLKLADRLDLLTVFNAQKKSGRPAGAVTASRLGRWVWLARHYGISYLRILRAISGTGFIQRDNRWVMIRVEQTKQAITRGDFSPKALLQTYDRLTPQERRRRILTTLTALAVKKAID
jgi:hypothetical protein